MDFLESLVPNIRISRSNGSWLFNKTCNTGSRFTESMSGSSYTQVLPLKPSSMTRYSAPNAFCNRQVQRSSSLYLLPWSALSDGSVQSPWVLESPMHKICFSLFNSPFSISVCNHPGSPDPFPASAHRAPALRSFTDIASRIASATVICFSSFFGFLLPEIKIAFGVSISSSAPPSVGRYNLHLLANIVLFPAAIWITL